MNEMLKLYLEHIQIRNKILAELVKQIQAEIKFSDSLIENTFTILKAGDESNENKTS